MNRSTQSKFQKIIGWVLLSVSAPVLIAAFIMKQSYLGWPEYAFTDHHGPFQLGFGLGLAITGGACLLPTRKWLLGLDAVGLYVLIYGVVYLGHGEARGFLLVVLACFYISARVAGWLRTRPPRDQREEGRASP